jgi:hypothetical protein
LILLQSQKLISPDIVNLRHSRNNRLNGWHVR